MLWKLQKRWQQSRPQLVHVATPGPLGWAAARAARNLGLTLTADFRTNFHQYSRYYGMGWLEPVVGAYLRTLHNAADRSFVPTRGLKSRLAQDGFRNLEVVGRGVDTQLFNPGRRSDALRTEWGADAESPVLLYVGRLAAEKNVKLALTAFETVRQCQPQARMVVVGDGPQRDRLRKAYPGVIFAGVKHGEELARHYAVSLSQSYRHLRQRRARGHGQRPGRACLRDGGACRIYRARHQRHAGAADDET
jgi:glycosyltransferase involved in cell wall biosynthesis